MVSVWLTAHSLPPFHSVANAVGAALATVAGDVDIIEILRGTTLEETLERIKKEAIMKAIANGAEKRTVRIVEVDVLPIQVGAGGGFNCGSWGRCLECLSSLLAGCSCSDCILICAPLVDST